jgi:hypothetical protein
MNIGGQTLIRLNFYLLHLIFLASWQKLSRKEHGLVGLISKHHEANKKGQYEKNRLFI